MIICNKCIIFNIHNTYNHGLGSLFLLQKCRLLKVCKTLKLFAVAQYTVFIFMIK